MPLLSLWQNLLSLTRLSASDQATLAEAFNQLQLSDTDAVAFAEAVLLQIQASETATLTEGVQLQLLTTDASTFTDSASIVGFASDSDTFALSDSQQLSLFTSDNFALIEQGSVTAFLTDTDSFGLVEQSDFVGSFTDTDIFSLTEDATITPLGPSDTSVPLGGGWSAGLRRNPPLVKPKRKPVPQLVAEDILLLHGLGELDEEETVKLLEAVK